MSLFFYILWLLLFGLIVGGLARLLVPGTGLQGCLRTSLLGIMGSLVGGLVGRWLFGDDAIVAGFALSWAGAVVFALILRVTRPRPQTPEEPD